MDVKEYHLELKPLIDRPLKTEGPIIIAGPCSGESREQVINLAKILKESGKISLFRCGIWKPRTRPNSFEGIGSEGLSFLSEIQKELSLEVTTEVATPKHVEEVLKWNIKTLWLGARTVVNPFLVQEIAESLRGVHDARILVKNPINTDLSLWIGALERLNQVGITKLAAIHRGFSTMDNSYFRYPPVWKIPIDLKRIFPELPLICDPSHIAGKRKFVADIAQTAINFDYDGLMIETHENPDVAKSDKEQQLRPTELFDLLEGLQQKNHNITSHELNFIDELRKKIDTIDHKLIELLYQRKEIVKDLGKAKIKQNLTIVQIERLKNMMKERVSHGLTFDLSEKYIEDIFSLLHDEAVRQQQDIFKH